MHAHLPRRRTLQQASLRLPPGRARRRDPAFSFRCELVPDRDRVRVRPEGELDISTVDEVERCLRELRERGFERLAVDLRGLTFMDSTGLRLIASADARAREDDRRLTIIQGPAAVRRVFEITRLDERLDIVDEDPPLASEAG